MTGEHLLMTMAQLMLLAAALLLLWAWRERGRRQRFHQRLVYYGQPAAAPEQARPGEPDRLSDALLAPLIQALRLLNRAFGSVVMVSRSDQEQLKQALVRAGLRHPEALALMFSAKAGMLLLGVLATLAACALEPLPDLGLVSYLAGGVPVIILLGAVPERLLQLAARRRQRRIAQALPDALDLMIMCTNAGCSLDLTITQVARETRLFSRELADEMRLTALELRMLPNRREALDNLVQRTDVSGIRSMVTALNQGQRYGTPISQSLRTTAAELRAHNLRQLEEWAGRIPVKMTVPIVLFILPAVFLIIAGPAFVHIMRTL